MYLATGAAEAKPLQELLGGTQTCNMLVCLKVERVISIFIYVGFYTISMLDILNAIYVGFYTWGNTNRVVSNRVVSKGPLYPSETKSTIYLFFDTTPFMCL